MLWLFYTIHSDECSHYLNHMQTIHKHTSTLSTHRFTDVCSVKFVNITRPSHPHRTLDHSASAEAEHSEHTCTCTHRVSNKTIRMQCKLHAFALLANIDYFHMTRPAATATTINEKPTQTLSEHHHNNKKRRRRLLSECAHEKYHAAM